MLVPSFVLSAALAVSVSASALNLRAVSNNNCGRAVGGTAKGPAFMSTARADCSSNVISYTTVTVSSSASTVTATAFASSTTSSIRTATYLGSTTVTSLVQSTQTVFDISTTDVTAVEIDTVSVSTVSPDPAVVTVTSLFTFTVVPQATITTTFTRPQKRAVATSKTIPAYASPCRDYAEYVAACSVIGIYTQLSTVRTTPPALTSTITVTSTQESTQIQTSSTEIVQSFTNTQTIISSRTQSSTFTNTAATVTTTTFLSTTSQDPITTFSLQTDTTTAPTAFQTSTISVSPPAPPGFLVRAKTGSKAGQYIYVNPGTNRYIFFTTNPALATRFTVNPTTGNLRDITTQYDIYMDSVGYIGVVYALDPATAATKTNTQLFKCVPAAGAMTGDLVCNNGNDFNLLVVCGAYLYGQKAGYTAASTCTVANQGVVLEAVSS